MDQQQQSGQSIFDLSLDGQSKGFLQESAKWGKFLAIVGFIFCGLILIGGIALSLQPDALTKSYDRFGYREDPSENLGPAMVVVYIAIAVLYFFPCLFLFRFSSNMKSALQSGDQATLVSSFRNLRSMFRFVGVLTIIVLAIYVIGIVVVAVGSNQ